MSGDADFIIHIIGGQYTFRGLGGIQCTTLAGNTDSVGVVKRVLNRTKSSVISSYAAVLIKPQPTTKDLSKLTIEDPIPTLVTTAAEGLDALWISGCIA